MYLAEKRAWLQLASGSPRGPDKLTQDQSFFWTAVFRIFFLSVSFSFKFFFFAARGCFVSSGRNGAAQPRPVSRSVAIGLHFVQAEQVEVPAMYLP